MLNHKTIITIWTVILLTFGFSSAGKRDNKESEVNFSGYSEMELDSLAYYWWVVGQVRFTNYSKIEEKLYRVDIHPVTPKDGILTGHVIAYGHYIKPPYKFEIKNDTILLINGVQIDPRIGLEERKIAYIWHFKRLKEESVREGFEPYEEYESQLADEIERLFKEAVESKGLKAALDTIRRLLQSDTMIYKYSVDSLSDSLVVVGIECKGPHGRRLAGRILELRTKPFKSCFEGAFPKPKDEAERIKWRRERLESTIARSIEVLEKGGFLLETDSYSRSDLAFRIYQIMEDSSLNWSQKAQQLYKLGMPAKDIIYNYSSKEYKVLEKRR